MLGSQRKLLQELLLQVLMLGLERVSSLAPAELVGLGMIESGMAQAPSKELLAWKL